ncbi:G-box-binding factor-like isoform X1 [Hibiscus syriacus]|uniref:G-box-binding factor-like isoform X1 n=1 Tax=Hibiscus syriacus TaxID=106335 RepID=UPI00192381FE|nr:G-box-binding factor-like isoform X1 [Hibiscus syriacus]
MSQSSQGSPFMDANQRNQVVKMSQSSQGSPFMDANQRNQVDDCSDGRLSSDNTGKSWQQRHQESYQSSDNLQQQHHPKESYQSSDHLQQQNQTQESDQNSDNLQQKHRPKESYLSSDHLKQQNQPRESYQNPDNLQQQQAVVTVIPSEACAVNDDSSLINKVASDQSASVTDHSRDAHPSGYQSSHSQTPWVEAPLTHEQNPNNYNHHRLLLYHEERDNSTDAWGETVPVRKASNKPKSSCCQ